MFQRDLPSFLQCSSMPDYVQTAVLSDSTANTWLLHNHIRCITNISHTLWRQPLVTSHYQNMDKKTQLLLETMCHSLYSSCCST